MNKPHKDLALKQLYDAFSLVEKPSPLTTYEGSYFNEEVDIFNELDWEEANYSDVTDGMEGIIICPALTRLYLLPRLFKMVIMRRSGRYEGAVDNLAAELEAWPVDPSVEDLLSAGQKKAVVAAWEYIDCYLYHPSGSQRASELAKRWESDL